MGQISERSLRNEARHRSDLPGLQRWRLVLLTSMARLFTGSNCGGAMVYDVGTKQELTHVMSVDIDAGEVSIAHQPLRTVGDEVATYTQRYAAIHPIYGGSRAPVLFHCYGRQG